VFKIVNRSFALLHKNFCAKVHGRSTTKHLQPASMSASSSSTIQDDSSSSASSSSSSQSPSPPFLKASSPEESDQECDLDEYDCDIALPGTEDFFGNSVVESDLFDDANLSARTLDAILMRAEARLKEQEDLAKELNIQQRQSTVSPVLDAKATIPKLQLPPSFMDSSKTIVHPNRKMLVPDKIRRLANKPTSTQHLPTGENRRNKKGKLSLFYVSVCCMMKIPNNSSRCGYVSRLGYLTALMGVYYIIVTLIYKLHLYSIHKTSMYAR
jgi:hypothetical protein